MNIIYLTVSLNSCCFSLLEGMDVRGFCLSVCLVLFFVYLVLLLVCHIFVLIFFVAFLSSDLKLDVSLISSPFCWLYEL